MLKFVILMLMAFTPVRDNGQWAQVDPRISNWFSSLTRPDRPMTSCCGEADAFESDIFDQENGHYVAVITNGRGIIPDLTRIEIPNEKIKYDAGNPTGHGWVFLSLSREVYCYVTPGGI